MGLIVANCPECDENGFVVDLAPKGLVFLAHKRIVAGADGLELCPGSDLPVDPADVRPFGANDA